MISCEIERCHTAIREGYRSLLTTDSELWQPVEYSRICQYYRRVRDACVNWAETAEGERLRRQYLALEEHSDRGRFPTARYEICCRPIWEESVYVTFLCCSVLQIGTARTERLMSQVWNVSEQTMLPMGQILKQFPTKPMKKRLPFRPDGVYPLEKEVVFYRNGDDQRGEEEFRVARVERKMT